MACFVTHAWSQPIFTWKTGSAASFLNAVSPAADLSTPISRSPGSSWAVSKYTFSLIARSYASSGTTLWKAADLSVTLPTRW